MLKDVFVILINVVINCPVISLIYIIAGTCLRTLVMTCLCYGALEIVDALTIILAIIFITVGRSSGTCSARLFDNYLGRPLSTKLRRSNSAGEKDVSGNS